MRNRGALSLFSRFLIASSVLPVAIVGYFSAPPPARTGAPGELTCWDFGCHNTGSGSLFGNSNQLSINFPDGPTYSPGVPQALRLEITDALGAFYGFQLSARDPANGQAGNLAPADASAFVDTTGGVQYLTHNFGKVQGVFDFEWTPPPADVGTITMYVAANAANGDGRFTGDRIHLKRFEINPAAPPVVPTISEGGVVQSNTFSADQGFSSNTFATVVGVDLTDVTLDWNDAFVDGVAPTTLGDTRVLYDGEPAFISFVGDSADIGQPFDQVNFVVPGNNAKGAAGVGMVEVEAGGVLSAPVMVMHQAPSPTFFPLVRTLDPQPLAAVHLDGTLVGSPDLIPGVAFREARAGDVVSLFGTGFGETAPPVPVGMLPGQVLEPGVTSTTVEDVRICFGDVEVVPAFAGLSGFVGLYQIVVTVPDVPAGDVLVLGKIGGVQTQDGISLRVAVPEEGPNPKRVSAARLYKDFQG